MYKCKQNVTTINGTFTKGQEVQDSQVKGFEKFFTKVKEVKEVEVQEELLVETPIEIEVQVEEVQVKKKKKNIFGL